MYVGYVLDKDSPGYPGPARPAGLGLSPQAYSPAPPAPPQYPDFTGYSHVEPLPAPSAAWSAPFPAPKDDWAAYGPGPAAPAGSPAPLAFGPPPDLSAGPAPPGPGPGLLLQPLGGPGAPSSPGAPRRTPYEWMRRSVAAGGAGAGSGKTRTKDKYRVVYTDHQRLELEKEFHYSRYITIRRKSELAANLGLTERQVKIWFQSRRAKERKCEQEAAAAPPAPRHSPLKVSSTPAGPPMGGLCPSSAGLLRASSTLSVRKNICHLRPVTTQAPQSSPIVLVWERCPEMAPGYLSSDEEGRLPSKLGDLLEKRRWIWDLAGAQQFAPFQPGVGHDRIGPWLGSRSPAKKRRRRLRPRPHPRCWWLARFSSCSLPLARLPLALRAPGSPARRPAPNLQDEQAPGTSPPQGAALEAGGMHLALRFAPFNGAVS
ncbi:LOW QUALITY PROTEIN: homeobox protein CDX-1 [Suncus etruscus]|uniref:LOW QUALITY PROTEIN: homeobox protein CDX-1 n=1 Tax=Suncus etruscus TaxID=109475 RepID=UPI002110BCFC|nr:LOW QUALITY PROTEIN: homeobox protein CDX-1 [Suncus etruscus]